jgi:3-hydroxyisobutyrate dehydrogenase-like beta-hydroxyacid dehydrogenase
MAAATVGLLHPGEMGAAVGAVLRGRGDRVVWASEGRTAETRERAEEAGLEDAGSVEELVRRSDLILSVCPPHAALEVAGAVAGFGGVFVDANAIAPGTAREVEAVIAAGGGDCVDGGIVGAPPRAEGTTRLYLSGPEAESVAGLFAASVVDARVLSGEVGTASALKMTYAAWTKGTAALLLAIGELARAEGVEPALHEEWRISLPDLPERSQRAARSAQAKGWRWVGEMEEIAATFAAAGLPDGFHRAAAEVFRTRSPGGRPR